MLFVPNRFQEAIYEFIANGKEGNLVIEGLAGTAKTSTIVEGLSLIPRNKKVIFLAYNRHIADELREKAPSWIEVRTTHSKGLEVIVNFNGERRTNSNNTGYKIFDILDDVITDRNTKYAKERNKIEIINDRLYRENRTAIVHVINHFRNNLLIVNEENLDYVLTKYDISITGMFTAAIIDLIMKTLEADKADTLSVDFGDMLYLPTTMLMPFDKYDYVFCDECLPGRTRILLANGEEKTISEIVKKQLPVEIVSYNTENKKQEVKKVIGWSEKPAKGKKMLKTFHAEKHKISGRSNGYFPEHTFFGTDNHVVFTRENGFIPSSELEIGNHIKFENAHGKRELKNVSGQIYVTKPSGDVFCEICGKICASSSAMGSHMRVHDPGYSGNKVSEKGHDILSKNAHIRNENPEIRKKIGRTISTKMKNGEMPVRFGGYIGNGKYTKHQLELYNELLKHDERWKLECSVSTGFHRTENSGFPSSYKIDIGFPEHKLGIEVHGKGHLIEKQIEKDKKKQDFLSRLGWKIIEIWNDEISEDVENCVEKVLTSLVGRSPQWHEIRSIEEIEFTEDYVYDIEVEDNHNFYAEGVLVHNCQDLNESQIRMLLMLRKPDGHIIAVGDRKQCVIEGSTIPTSKGLKKVEEITTKDYVQCGIGNAITDFAPAHDIFVKKVINKPMVKVITDSGNELTTTPEHIHFARYQEGYKKDSSKKNYLIYLMYKEGLGYRIGFTKSHKARMNQENADKVWFLDSVKTLNKANYLEQFYSVKYGLPRWIFRTNLDIVSYTQEDVEKLFSSLDTETGARELLESKNMYIEYPHHIPKCSTLKRRRNFSITMCGDWRQEKDGKKNPTMHRYSISGSDSKDGELLKSIGLNVRQAKVPGSWRVESSSSKLGDVYEKLKQVQSVMEVNVIETARLGSRALTLTPASHILPGMGIYIENDGKIIEDTVIDVQHEMYTGNVYDINVNRYHNYIANGIVTHNSLYGFRGADTEAMEKIKLATDAKTLPLNICYRCPRSHIEEANKFVPEMEPAPGAIEGTINHILVEELENFIKPGDLAICRNNAPLVKPALSLLRRGIKVNIRGKDVKSSLVDLIKKTGTNDLEEMKEMLIVHLKSEIEFLESKGKNPSFIIDKTEIILEFAELVNTPKELINYIYKLFNDKNTEIVFSTVHGAKGMEANNIFFIKPSLIPSPYAKQEWELQGEANIMYVALTRSKNTLYIVED